MTEKPTSYRYQVSCSYCGLLDTFSNFKDAVAYARRMRNEYHKATDEYIYIYDLLAHFGQFNLFTSLGIPLESKVK
jgi:hypothetical protein